MNSIIWLYSGRLLWFWQACVVHERKRTRKHDGQLIQKIASLLGTTDHHTSRRSPKPQNDDTFPPTQHPHRLGHSHPARSIDPVISATTIHPTKPANRFEHLSRSAVRIPLSSPRRRSPYSLRKAHPLLPKERQIESLNAQAHLRVRRDLFLRRAAWFARQRHRPRRVLPATVQAR